jgi:DNA polymerase-1
MIYLVTNQVSFFNPNWFKIISLEEGINLLQGFAELGIDTETQGLDCYTKQLLLLQIGNAKFQVLFDISSYGGTIPPQLKDYLNTSTTLFLLQNAKFDLKFLFHQGVILTKVYDTFLAEVIITNGLQYAGRDLESLALKYCQKQLDKSVRGEIIKRGLSDRVLVYAAEDVEFLPQIKRMQLGVAKDLNLTNAIALDNSFVIVLAYVEYCGIKLDYDKWVKRTVKNVEEAYELKLKLEDQLLKDGKSQCFSGMSDLWSGKQDCIINWDSPKQVLKVLESYGIKVTVREKGIEKKSIDAKVLDPQRNKFSILPFYLDYKAKQKDISTYGTSWKNKINPITGRIHTTFKQLVDTGRLSCGNKDDGTPNLQNLPSDHETRSCFIPEKGNIMIDADYSGQETIVLANFSQEDNLINFYAKGLNDMHSYVAYLMYEKIRPCAIEDVTPETLEHIKKYHKDKRQIAKAAGFAIAYGGNGSTIAKNCNIPQKDGDFVYKSYFDSFPKMKNYFDLVLRKACHFGYIQFNNVTGRKYFFNIAENHYFQLRDQVEDPYFWQHEPNAREIFRKYSSAQNDMSRIAQNYPIQGSAADITKYACILFFKAILTNKWWMKVKIVNLIHDEILVECPEEMLEEVQSILLKCMEEAGKPFCTTVPLKASAESGLYWVH